MSLLNWIRVLMAPRVPYHPGILSHSLKAAALGDLLTDLRHMG